MALVRDPAPSRIPVFQSYIHMFDTSIFDGYTRLYHQYEKPFGLAEFDPSWCSQMILWSSKRLPQTEWLGGRWCGWDITWQDPGSPSAPWMCIPNKSLRGWWFLPSDDLFHLEPLVLSCSFPKSQVPKLILSTVTYVFIPGMSLTCLDEVRTWNPALPVTRLRSGFPFPEGWSKAL